MEKTYVVETSDDYLIKVLKNVEIEFNHLPQEWTKYDKARVALLATFEKYDKITRSCETRLRNKKEYEEIKMRR